MPLETQRIRVLVVDDHQEMRQGIIGLVNAQPDMKVVGQAGDGRLAIEQFKALKPDVAVLDWNLPIVPGEEVVRALRAEFSNARIIVVSALSGDETVRIAIQLGVSAYLCKDMLRRELLPAIRAVFEGRRYFPEKIADRFNKNS